MRKIEAAIGIFELKYGGFRMLEASRDSTPELVSRLGNNFADRFPEISIDKVNKISGMDITFVTTAQSDEESFELLKAFGMPFANKNAN